MPAGGGRGRHLERREPVRLGHGRGRRVVGASGLSGTAGTSAGDRRGGTRPPVSEQSGRTVTGMHG